MSSWLYWRQYVPPTEGNTIEAEDQYHFRSMLGQRFLGHDGSIRYDPDTVIISRSGVIHSWVQGMADNGSEAAKEILDLIEEHGPITVWVGE